MENSNIQIGYEFYKRQDVGGIVYTVCDIHTTTDNNGEFVRFRYVVSHYFLGQKVIDQYVVGTTILMGTRI